LTETDSNGLIYTTTIYSTRGPPSITPSTSNPNPANIQSNGRSTPNVAAIIAGIGGGVGLFLLLVGVTWFIWARRAKRRTANDLISDRKFYPDRYNQTVTSNRHSEFIEIDPDPVVVQSTPPQLPPPPLAHQAPSGPFPRRTSSYRNYIPSSQTRGSWAGAPPTDGVLEDIPPLTRHRVPYPNSPPQPLVDRYTVPPSRSASNSNTPTHIRFVPHPPHHSRSSPSTHRHHYRYHSYHDRPPPQGYDVERDPWFPRIPKPPAIAMRMPRRSTVFVSPPMSPSSFSILSSPSLDLPATRTEPTTITLSSHPSVTTRSTFSSIDSFVTVNDTTKRMRCTNPDLDVDLGSDTEPNESSRGGSGAGGSPSPTDIIRLYDRDQDEDTSPTGSMLGEKDDGLDTDPPTVTTTPIPMSTKGD